MPGYETERFVDLSENDKAELICSICQDILCRPIVAQCCQQSFCEDCINDWLKTNNTCPYDRKAMTSNGLSRPPRFMLNALGKLKIKCDYQENGCNQLLLLENLSQHTGICGYNVVKCEKCLCEIQDKSSHDCIKSLLEINRKANEENSLREVSLLEEIREFKTEKENFLKTIQELSNITDQQSSQDCSEMDIFSQARKRLWNPEIIQNVMNEEITRKVLSIVKNELIHDNMSDIVVCTNIVDKLNTEFGSLWHCLVGEQKSILSCFYENGYFIKFINAEVNFKIYKNRFLNGEEFIKRFKSGKIKREIHIFRTVMKENMISDVKKFTFQAIEKSNTLVEIASEIKKQMETTYEGNWQCFLYGYR